VSLRYLVRLSASPHVLVGLDARPQRSISFSPGFSRVYSKVHLILTRLQPGVIAAQKKMANRFNGNNILDSHCSTMALHENQFASAARDHCYSTESEATGCNAQVLAFGCKLLDNLSVASGRFAVTHACCVSRYGIASPPSAKPGQFDSGCGEIESS